MSNKELSHAIHCWEIHCLSVVEDLCVGIKNDLLDSGSIYTTADIWRHIDDTRETLKKVFSEVMRGSTRLVKGEKGHWHKCKLMMFMPESFWVEKGIAPPSSEYLFRFLQGE